MMMMKRMLRTASMRCFTTSLSKNYPGIMSTSKKLSMADESINLEISDLHPKQKITLHSAVRSSNSALLECFSHYIADDDGSVFLDKHESRGGYYKGIEPMGPLSFMRPSDLNNREHERFLIKDPTKTFGVDFRVFDGFLEATSQQNRFHTDPHLSVTRTYMAEGVKEYPIWHGNVRATLYIPSGNGPFPGVISMSGGYPGAMKYKAALLASHGFASLALKYFGEDDLNQELLFTDLAYIEEAVNFMINHPVVDGTNGVGFSVNCYGATVALAAASVLPEGCIRCIATTNGWPFPYGIIHYKGERLAPNVPPRLINYPGKDGVQNFNFQYSFDTSNFDTVKDLSLKFFNQHQISYLFVVGSDDGYFHSAPLFDVTKSLLEDANHPDYEMIYLEGAGHLIEHSYNPLAAVTWTLNEPHFTGGRQPFHSLSQVNSWPRILSFLHNKLRTSVS